MKKLLLLLFLLPIVVGQQACDPKQCSAKSQVTGTYFCKSDDLYAQYLEYYCAGNECVARTTDRLIEDCQLGCVLDRCVTCDAKDCEAKTGYYSPNFCKGDVFRVYREYYCATAQGCVFRESERLVEDCDEGVECTQGRCGLCDPLECNARDGFYGDDFCGISGNVYRQYRDYTCTKGKCAFSLQDIKIADCPHGCTDAKCALPRCIDCDSKDAFFGESYCKGNSVYRAFRDYFCGDIKCEFKDTEKKLEDCRDCSSGKCVIIKARNERVFEFDVKFSNETMERNLTMLPKRIFNGLLFGSNDMRIEADAFVKSVSFAVLDTNKLGEINVFADSDRVFSTNKAGLHSVLINKYANQIIVSSSSSGFIFWMPAVYDLGATVVTVLEEKTRRNEFAFALSKSEQDKLKSAEVIAWPASTRIILNGKVLESNAIDKGYLQLQNKIEFLSLINETFSRKATFKIVYEE